MKSKVLQTKDGQIEEAHSIAAGLDYPSVGPEHAYLQEIGRAKYESADDQEALAAFQELSCSEGIIPALESAHALAFVKRLCAKASSPPNVLINLSGRGDKDLAEVMKHVQAL